MAINIQTPFGFVSKNLLCESEHFTNRKPSKQILDEFYEVIKRKSESAKKGCLKYERLIYGDKKEQFMDVFYPKDHNPESEIVIYYHGGYWHKGSPEIYWFLSKPITEDGKVCILISRILCPQVRIQDILHQDQDAMLFIANKFNQSHGVTLFGYSSGGHESVMMLSHLWSGKHTEVEEYFRNKLIRVVALCGIFDVTHLLLTDVDKDLEMSWEEAVNLSPSSHVKQLAANMKNYKCELNLIYAENDAPTIQKWKTIYEKVKAGSHRRR